MKIKGSTIVGSALAVIATMGTVVFCGQQPLQPSTAQSTAGDYGIATIYTNMSSLPNLPTLIVRATVK